MVNLPNISIHLNTTFKPDQANEFNHTFYSGPIDLFFNHVHGQLGYRTLDFKVERYDGDYQGNAVINYCDNSVPWTRISEHKHFAPWEMHDKTIIYKEYSRLCELNDTPYYPIRLVNEQKQLRSYIDLANAQNKVTFLGRLGTYRYLDMHVTISEAFDVVDAFIHHVSENKSMPAFVVNPI
jgi:UDP-galactopyranose mutase